MAKTTLAAADSGSITLKQETTHAILVIGRQWREWDLIAMMLNFPFFSFHFIRIVCVVLEFVTIWSLASTTEYVVDWLSSCWWSPFEHWSQVSLHIRWLNLQLYLMYFGCVASGEKETYEQMHIKHMSYVSSSPSSFLLFISSLAFFLIHSFTSPYSNAKRLNPHILRRMHARVVT